MDIKYYTFRLDVDWKTNPVIQDMMIRLADFIKANFCKYCIFKEIADITKKEHLQGWVGCKWAKTTANRI